MHCLPAALRALKNGEATWLRRCCRRGHCASHAAHLAHHQLLLVTRKVDNIFRIRKKKEEGIVGIKQHLGEQVVLDVSSKGRFSKR